MSFNFWLSQVFGIIALILVCLSYQFNDKKKFLAFQVLANLFYASAFLALNVLVGGINTLISLLRVIFLYFYEKKNLNPPKILFLTFFVLYIISGIVCFQTPLDILAMISYEIFNLAMFIRDISLTRKMMVFPNIIIVIYNILLMTYTNALLDLLEIIVLLVAIFRFSKHREIKKGRFIY